MRLSQLKWTRHNRTHERSQLLFQPDGVKCLTYRAVEPDADGRYSIHNYLGGIVARGNEIAIDAALKEFSEYDPTQMTPLERKCWEIEQRKAKGNDDAGGQLRGERAP